LSEDVITPPILNLIQTTHWRKAVNIGRPIEIKPEV
jgi:hypothetical protein